ncbi:Hint domain-containing protein [Sphingopyxis sp. GW247-27LB]|uniref:Hint domain-containing protein n=1 Tax=Sphingopyxis sp. GW247-27LB TaxID=2012632 RepID=UPI000BA548E3|nr:Hint domain-containing protein [Sphingopyxis sp. GW247-27LB]PAL23523.1 hypothetical protein CD928_05500 [Sphingopyxis sp. GW247-27LB]
MLTFGSACSGIEAASVAWLPLGWRCEWVAEIDKDASALLAYRYPDVPNLGDMTLIPGLIEHDLVAAPDVFVAGTPCFAAGTFVTTPDGLRPIEDIRVGDLVLTHQRRWRRVLRVGSKFTSETIVVKGQGHPGLLTTPEHPFWACEKNGFATRRNGRSVWDTWIEGPSWVEAKDLRGKHWASVAAFPDTSIPPIVCNGNERASAPFNEDFFWLIGAFVGDGWTRMTDRRSYILYGVNAAKAKLIIERAEAIGWHVTETETRTGVRLQICVSAAARWIREQFGHGADGKRIPGWLFGIPRHLRRAWLDGYIAMDGTANSSVRGHRIATINRELAIGTRMVANSLGHASSIDHIQPNRSKCIIEGRTVNERAYYTVTISNSNRSSFERDNMRFGCVRSVEPGPPTQVFNLEVEEDNSYCADGFVVHNSQGFSLAGLRGGMSDPRGRLTLTYVEIVDALDSKRRERGEPPVIAVWENVPGALSMPDNSFGSFLAALAGDDVALEPGERPATGKDSQFWKWDRKTQQHRPKWPVSGVVAGPERSVAWIVRDAQYYGLAQRRRRVFVVASARADFDPGEVLLELDCVRRDFAPSREAGESVAHDVAPCLTGSGSGRGIERTGDTRGQDCVVAVAGSDRVRWPAEIAPTLNAHFGTKMGLEDQHIAGGGGLFVPATRIALPQCGSDGATGRRDGDADSYYRSRLR